MLYEALEETLKIDGKSKKCGKRRENDTKGSLPLLRIYFVGAPREEEAGAAVAGSQTSSSWPSSTP